MDYRKLMEFYKGKRVLVTGHTGFKGSWMYLMCWWELTFCGKDLIYRKLH